MSMPFNGSDVDRLSDLLLEKRKVFFEMINENKEFEEVKTLFIEIRELEKSLRVNHDNPKSGSLQ